MLSLRDSAKAMSKNELSCTSHEFQSFIYDMSNKYIMPLND